MKHHDPFDMARAGFEIAKLSVESNAVIWMRMMGMGGAWNTPFDEGYRMWREKPDAFAEAFGRGVDAAMAGQSPANVISATIAPLNRDASENRDRLSRRGMRVSG